jgi:hypothetical protein
MKYNNIQLKIATTFLIHLINTVESSHKVSRLLNIELTHYKHEYLCLIFKGMQFLILLMIRANLFLIAV